ncbi:Alpha/Beta hydrolase protein [Hygrophoropsis aurantiaca]|uniref:Alpha/Beta hydrolase protein n=1 Tax=Hygrophoropsis aurantiaca TaxID=72124 RepID=A0ACB7ZSR4_9AGAM|nr:Alpha/Beta hydrolase protein [Hygrophoropsis aurantiaca]
MSAQFPPGLESPLTFAYKHVGEEPILLDVFLPLHPERRAAGLEVLPAVPAVIYFHGGGLAVGNRRSWFPAWLQNRLSCLGYIFISADYRLVPPSTGHDILEDVKDAFHFVSNQLNHTLDAIYLSQPSPAPHSRIRKYHVNPNALAAAGTSAGGLCAYLAAMHISPTPRAILSLYGMGGNFLSPHYLAPKTTPFFRGRELLDPADFSAFLYPSNLALTAISDSALAYHPQTHVIPGYPANPRMLLGRLYLQLGVTLDYYTGRHAPSLSLSLRDSLLSPRSPSVQIDTEAIGARDTPLFPQFGVTSGWPPTFLAHGTSDTAVPLADSHTMQALLERAGVEVTLLAIEGAEHSFDYAPDAEARYEREFDAMAGFLGRHLGGVR